MGLREIVYFKTTGSDTFDNADYPCLPWIFVQVQAAGGGAAGARANASQLVAPPAAGAAERRAAREGNRLDSGHWFARGDRTADLTKDPRVSERSLEQ
ncbi:hypothetical protein ACFW9X_06615 [Streptomyces sp. NPDC059466]|uniref:hypothetical protein n=1 Tax=Streptomyces sp. NPDC059466 TaxID=3346843 RepID=UPI0036BCC162